MTLNRRVDRIDRARQNERLAGPATIQQTAAHRASASSVRRARTQEAGQSDGLLSVKLIDKTGSVTGEAFDVWVWADRSVARDMADYAPEILAGDDVLITKLHGAWYLLWTAIPATESDATITFGQIVTALDYAGTNGYTVRIIEDYPDWQAGTYPAGSKVTHDSAYWQASIETSGEPGVSGDWSDISVDVAVTRPLDRNISLVDCIPWFVVGDIVPMIEHDSQMYIHATFVYTGSETRSLMWNANDNRAMAVWK